MNTQFEAHGVNKKMPNIISLLIAKLVFTRAVKKKAQKVQCNRKGFTKRQTFTPSERGRHRLGES